MFSVTLYTNAWYMETAEVAVHLIALLHPCGVLLVEKWPRIPPVGKTPPGKGPAPFTSGEETSVSGLVANQEWLVLCVCGGGGGESLEIRLPPL